MLNQLKEKTNLIKTKAVIALGTGMAMLTNLANVHAEGSGININIQEMTSNLGNSTNSTAGIDSAGETVVNVINSITGWLMALSVGVALIYGIISAWKMMSSGGNPQKKEQAKQSLFNVLIGCGIIGGLSLIVKVALGLFA